LCCTAFALLVFVGASVVIHSSPLPGFLDCCSHLSLIASAHFFPHLDSAASSSSSVFFAFHRNRVGPRFKLVLARFFSCSIPFRPPRCSSPVCRMSAGLFARAVLSLSPSPVPFP
jgi:hypothetical protein